MTAPRRRRSTTPVECWCKYRHQHGTRRMYVAHRCGCFDCRLAHALSVQRVRAGGSTTENRYTDPTGTRRRIEALSAAGFSHADVARHIGTSKEAVAYFRTATRVHVATVERITTAYDDLTALMPPSGWQADRTRREARSRGWAPPLAWDDDAIDNPAAAPLTTGDASDELDEVAVERLIGGTLRLPRNSQSPEMREAVRRLAAAGFNDPAIAERVGLTAAGVCAMRIRRSIAPGVPRGAVA